MIVSKNISNDPHRIQFRASAQSARSGAVDLKTGRISGVSLLTADREATGWGLWIDAKTLATFHALLTGRRLKAYATHGAPGLDGTLDEVGFWDGSHIDGANLRGDFTALDAWRRHSPAEFETLFELAEKLPAEFGASLSFSFQPVWVLRDGREIATTRKFSGAGLAVYDPPAPMDTVRALPSVRAVDVYSADFVDDPAANEGLFAAGPIKAAAPALFGKNRAAAAFNVSLARTQRPASPCTSQAKPASTRVGLSRAAAAWGATFAQKNNN